MCYIYAMEKEIKAKLLYKKELIKGVFEIVYKLDSMVDFKPGQFANILVKKPYRRPYSIVEINNNAEVKFIIQTDYSGIAANYFKNTKVGTITKLKLPIGNFLLKKIEKDNVFVAAGTGIAPIIPMIKMILKESNNAKIKLFFGISRLEDDYAVNYLKEEIENNKIEYYRCVSSLARNALTQYGSKRKKTDEDVVLDEYTYRGRVTKVIKELNYDFSESDVYISGSAEMVRQTKSLVIKQGGVNIFLENYGY